MQSSKSVNVEFEAQEPSEIDRTKFMGFLENAMRRAELSWLVTEKRSFDWSEINLDRKKFKKEINELQFKKAYVGIFYSEEKKTEYTSFKIIQ
jgi:hypothetical protein